MTLSNHQSPMLRLFVDRGLDKYLSIPQMQQYDQRSFRSMLQRGYVAYRAGRGFHITRKGLEAWQEFRHTNILRKNPYGPLTSYFDLAARRVAVVTDNRAA